MEFNEEILSQQNAGTLSGSVTVTFEDDIAILYMDCGENRHNVTFVQKMLQALEQVERNEDVKVLITTGRGKFYSNGLDLDWLLFLAQKDPNYGVLFRDKYMQKLITRLLTFPMPTIAAINGHCYAGGCIPAAAHDYMLMTSGKGWFCLNEVHLNLRLAKFTQLLMRAKLGRAYHEALVLGKRFTGQEAVRAGFVHQCLPESQLIPGAKQLALNLVARGPYSRESLGNMKVDMCKELFLAREEDKNNTNAQNVFRIKSKV